MPGLSHADLAAKYLVDDLRAAAIIGSRLNGLLGRIEGGAELNEAARTFLASCGLDALLALATGQTEMTAFREQAARERDERIRAAQAKSAEQATERTGQAEERRAGSDAWFARNEPIQRRRPEAREPRDRFLIDHVRLRTHKVLTRLAVI